MSEVTRILGRIEAGDSKAANELMPLVYDELRRLAASQMAREIKDQTLDATGLVHEAWLRLAGPDGVRFENRNHFFGAAAESMRRILIDAARRRARLKHGGQLKREPLRPNLIAAMEPDEQLLELDAALNRLAELDPVKSRLVELRYFAGLTGDQAAEILEISPSTADRHWAFSKAWLQREMESSKDS